MRAGEPEQAPVRCPRLPQPVASARGAPPRRRSCSSRPRERAGGCTRAAWRERRGAADACCGPCIRPLTLAADRRVMIEIPKGAEGTVSLERAGAEVARLALTDGARVELRPGDVPVLALGEGLVRVEASRPRADSRLDGRGRVAAGRGRRSRTREAKRRWIHEQELAGSRWSRRRDRGGRGRDPRASGQRRGEDARVAARRDRVREARRHRGPLEQAGDRRRHRPQARDGGTEDHRAREEARRREEGRRQARCRARAEEGRDDRQHHRRASRS